MSFVEEMADEIVFLLDGHIHFRGSQEALKNQYQESNLERAIAKILEGKMVFSSNGVSKETSKLKLEKTI